MKIRIGFVSNSNSASFVIKVDDITPNQLDLIMEYQGEDSWHIFQEGDSLHGFTIMDYGDMMSYLKKIGIPAGAIDWEGDE